MVKEKITCPYGVRPAKDTATTISSGMTKKMLSQSRAGATSSLPFFIIAVLSPRLFRTTRCQRVRRESSV